MFKKSLGQNFIFDEVLLQSVVDKLDISAEDVIAEVGTGAGTFTLALARKAKKVVSFEIDRRLESVVTQKFHGVSNIELIFRDFLKVTDAELDKFTGGPFKAVANIPYYITSPLLLRFIRNSNCREICVLVQDEVAERITAVPGTKNYGALSVTMQSAAECTVIKKIPRTVFTPRPNVDSAFVRCKVRALKPLSDCSVFDKLVKGMFGARRKTAVNSIRTCFNFDKETAVRLLASAYIDENQRPDSIAVEQFIDLANVVVANKR